MFKDGTLAAEYVAKAAAASSAGIAGISWIAQLNDVLQLIATAVGIIAGIYAIVWHRARIANLTSKVEEVHEEIVSEQSNRDSAGRTPRGDS